MAGEPVSHPLLDRVRSCSTTPNAAANFFAAILHPDPTKRLTSAQALHHPYLKRCVSQMQLAQYAQTPSQGPGFISAECHKLACAPLPASRTRLGPSCSARKLNPLQSVLSGLFSRTAGTCNFDPRNDDPLSKYFPDYTHASSDAELCPVPDSGADTHPAKFQHSMDQLHQASGKEVYSHPIEVCSHPIEVCSHPIEIYSHPIEICSHPIEILPEDEEETAVPENAPSICQPRLHLCFDGAKGSSQPCIKSPQAAGPEKSRTCSITADAAIHAMPPGDASDQQRQSRGLCSDETFLEEPCHAKPDPSRYGCVLRTISTIIQRMMVEDPSQPHHR